MGAKIREQGMSEYYRSSVDRYCRNKAVLDPHCGQIYGMDGKREAVKLLEVIPREKCLSKG